MVKFFAFWTPLSPTDVRSSLHLFEVEVVPYLLLDPHRLDGFSQTYTLFLLIFFSFSLCSLCSLWWNFSFFRVVSGLNLFLFTPLDNNYIRGYRTEKWSYPTGFIRVRVAIIMKIIKGTHASILQKLDSQKKLMSFLFVLLVFIILY